MRPLLSPTRSRTRPSPLLPDSPPSTMMGSWLCVCVCVIVLTWMLAPLRFLCTLSTFKSRTIGKQLHGEVHPLQSWLWHAEILLVGRNRVLKSFWRAPWCAAWHGGLRAVWQCVLVHTVWLTCGADVVVVWVWRVEQEGVGSSRNRPGRYHFHLQRKPEPLMGGAVREIVCGNEWFLGEASRN